MSRILVTGGSGFIGTNLVQSFLDKGLEVLSIDVRAPQNGGHCKVFRKADILIPEELKDVVDGFEPTQVVHLAARTDLNGKNVSEYQANTTGVKNLLDEISKQTSVKRCIFASTKIICANGYIPKYDEDYCPDTPYGQSKVIGEKMVRANSSLKCVWCIVRPTSIWGPWFNVPYRAFFLSVAKGLYFHPGRVDPPKNFGYVGNVVYQIQKLLEATDKLVHKKTFYLSDYDVYKIKTWADTIAIKLKGRKVPVISEFVVRLAAWTGDIMQMFGYRNPPMTSFRLMNMKTDTTGTPIGPLKEITGPLPYTMETGVEETLTWLKEREFIK